MSKIVAYEANSPLQKRFHDFSQRGSVFGFYWDWTLKLHTLRYSNPLSAILEDFFSIRFKPHQVVCEIQKDFFVAKVFPEVYVKMKGWETGWDIFFVIHCNLISFLLSGQEMHTNFKTDDNLEHNFLVYTPNITKKEKS